MSNLVWYSDEVHLYLSAEKVHVYREGERTGERIYVLTRLSRATRPAKTRKVMRDLKKNSFTHRARGTRNLAKKFS